MVAKSRPQPDPADGRVTKAQANYKMAENDLQNCGKCVSFNGGNRCAKVYGTVAEGDICDLYQSSTEPEEGFFE